MDLRSDLEVLFVAWAAPRWPAAAVTTELDNALALEVPVIQPTGLPGGGDGARLYRQILDVDVFAATRGQASLIAREVERDVLGDLRGSTVNGVVIAHTETVSGPALRPYENTGLRRIGATYQIYMHLAALIP